MADIDKIFEQISIKQNIVRNEVGIDQILNRDANIFFPRKADIFVEPLPDFETYDKYIDKNLLQKFVDCYAIKTETDDIKTETKKNRNNYSDDIQVIKKNYQPLLNTDALLEKKDNSFDFFPYFIKTCKTTTKKHCHKKIKDAQKKFIKHDPINTTYSIQDESITVKKYGEIGNRFQPKKVKMTFSFNKEERKITFTYLTRKMRSKSITSDYISYEDFIPENKLMQKRESKSDVIVTLNGTKWNETNSSKEVRNMVFIIEGDYISKYNEFIQNIKKHILSEDNEKVIAADFYRSTMICDPEKFKDQIKLFMEFINERGGLIGKINNTFKENNEESGKYIPYFYYGLNVTFFIFHYEKEKYIAFEVQFHTEATFKVKQEQHNDFDIQKGFDKIHLPTDEFKEDEKIQKLKELNEIYNKYMKYYDYDKNEDKKRLINSISLQIKVIDSHKSNKFFDTLDQFLKKNPIVKLFYHEEDHIENILKNKSLIDKILDKTSLETRLNVQIELMKQLFISCRCIKNNKYFHDNNEKNDFFDIKEMNELVTSLNCENYYHYISEHYLENKYKDPKFDVKRHFKLIDFFDRDNEVRYISDLTKNGLFLEDLNETFFKYLFEFLFGRPISNDGNVTEANKTEFITEAIKTEFNNVMKKNIGNPPFKLLLSVENPIHRYTY